MEETAYKLADGIEPYDVTEWRESSAECDYCGEGWDLEEKHRHRFYVHRDGAAVRTADELAQVFQHDTAALVAGYVVPEWITALELDRGTGSAWCEDPDDAQALYDAIADAESALCDVGLSSYWDDGYVIESVELESDSAAELESGSCAHDAGTFPPNDDREIVCRACWQVIGHAPELESDSAGEETALGRLELKGFAELEQ